MTYYYIGENKKYGLLIIRKIQCINKLSNLILSTWEKIYIWEDTCSLYEKLRKLSTIILNLNKSVDSAEFILINMRNEENNFLIRNMLKFLQMKPITNIESMETDAIYKRLLQLESESKTTIADMNIIPIINQYITGNMDIYMEIMRIKYGASLEYMKYIISHHNIYKIEPDFYFIDIDNSFCASNEIGVPPDYSHKDFCIHNEEDTDIEERKLCENIPIERILQMHAMKDSYSKNYSKKGHDLFKCLTTCNLDECKIFNSISTNLTAMCNFIYRVNKIVCEENNPIFHIRHFNTKTFDFNNSLSRTIKYIYYGGRNVEIIVEY